MQASSRSRRVTDLLLLTALVAAGTSATASDSRVQKRAISSRNRGPQFSSSLCLSKACINAASSVLNKMDTTTDPCEDFYRFACGGFIDNTVIPDDRSSQSGFSITRDELKLRMRLLVDSPASGEDAPATAMIKRHYTSCSDKEGIEARGVKPLQDVLKEMGGWPVVEGERWNGTGFHWTKLMYANRRLGYGISYLFNFGVYTDFKNSSKRIIDLDDPSLGMGRKYLIKGFNDSDVQGYFGYITDMAVLLGADSETAKQQMEDALMFEIALANMSRAAEQRRNYTEQYNLKSLRQLQQEVPDIPWLEYANAHLNPAGVEVTEDEIINVSHLEYLKNLTKLLQNTPDRTVANYLLWRIVRASVDELNLKARDIRLRYFDSVYGVSEHQPRWKECLSDILSSYSIAAGSMYVKKHFGEEEKRAALSMVADIHEEFDNMLRDLDWMDNTTRQRALDKSSTIIYHIGYPEELFNDTLVGAFYEKLNTTSDDFFGNVRRRAVFNTNYGFGKLREPVDKHDWRKHGKMAVVNAFYRSSENSITFPAGILQGDFYGGEKPRYLNYGGIGMVIGHEITHGFDDKGRQFDAEGELQDWWEPETREKFLNKTKCMIEQYGNITVESAGLALNGITTQGENIADNGGVKVARLAYDRYQQKNGRESALPGLQQYSNEQMFWLGHANAWCSVQRPESLRKLILTDPHSPAFARVNRVLRNLRQFADDWQCPRGSGMNPGDACAVW